MLSGIKPAEPGRPARDEPALRARLGATAGEVMARIDAGGTEFPGEPGPPALDDPDALARVRATFVDGTDGWLLATIPGARGSVYTGGHLPGPDIYGEIYDWLAG